jgi:hypothetical protein
MDVQPEEARTFLTDFGHSADSLKTMPDADVVKLHGTVRDAASKHITIDPNKPWYEGFKDPQVKEWLAAYKGAYPNPEAVAQKALNLEKYMGAEKAGRGLIVPKPDSKPEEWQAFWRKVGAPEKPDQYKLPEGLDKDPGMVELRDHAHKLGVPAQLFEGLTGFLVDKIKATDDNDDAEFAARSEKEMNELRQEWKGVEFDRLSELGRRAATAFVPHKNADELEGTLTRIEGAIGTKAMMKLWANIGKAIGEHGFVGGDLPSPDGGMTPAQARIRIADLKRDKEFAAKLAARNTEAMTEWDKLNKIAVQGAIRPQ